MAARNAKVAKRIRSDSLSAKIADELRTLILSGELREGQSVTQDGIAKEYSVSTMPVREALLALSYEGMVEARPHRGFRVARMGKQDIRDIYWMHGVIAGRLAARASSRLAESDLSVLEENNSEFAVAVDTGNMDDVVRLYGEFHRVINLGANSPKLLGMLKTTARQVPKHFYALLLESGELSLRDHRALLKTLRERNAAEAESIAVQHVNATGRIFITYLENQNYWAGQ